VVNPMKKSIKIEKVNFIFNLNLIEQLFVFNRAHFKFKNSPVH